MDEPTRRDLVRRLVAAGGASALSACLAVEEDAHDAAGPGDAEDAGHEPPDRRITGDAASQHSWNAHLAAYDAGGHVPPRHHLVLSLDYRDTEADAAADALEGALHDLERRYRWSHDGLLFTAAYSRAYFARHDLLAELGVPLPEPRAMTPWEAPSFERPDLLLRLSSDRGSHLLDAEESLVDGATVADGDADGAHFAVRERRTGFIGQGLPHRKQAAAGLGADGPVEEGAPEFMGFRTDLGSNQADEAAVTIEHGPMAGGTTVHVSTIEIDVARWYASLSRDERVQHMWEATAHLGIDGIGAFGMEAEEHRPFRDRTDAHAREKGVVGHAEKVARARRDDEPPLLRRDFDTVRDGRPGLLFVSLQRRIEAFERVRALMNGGGLAAEHDAIGETERNGILDFITVHRRGNFLMPPVAHRALPLLG